MSIVEPAVSEVPGLWNIVTSSKNGSLPGASGKFSGEVDGFVTSQPRVGCGTR